MTTTEEQHWFGLICLRCNKPFKATSMHARRGLCCRKAGEPDEQFISEASGT